jgi:hypothetical protein
MADGQWSVKSTWPFPDLETGVPGLIPLEKNTPARQVTVQHA